jgi:hypothetical protein
MSSNIFSKRNAGNMLCAAGLVVSVVTSLALSKTDVPLFLFSGQSNMVCLGSANSDLPAADKSKTYDNIKIHNRSDNASSKWSTLKPGFGGDASHFGPELYFGKVLMDSMPNTKFAFIKDATSGTYLGKDSPQAPGWLPPSSGGPGGLYKNMMTHIDNALKEFKDAYDTSLYTPKWAGFIWLQGEFDGWNDQALANKYETNLTNLIKDIRQLIKADSMPVVIPMISGSSWQYLSIINAAEVAVAKKLVNTDTMSTKGFSLAKDNVHFNAQSQVKIGTISAQRWLAMKYLDVAVPVIDVPEKTLSLISATNKNITSYDLTGRKIAQLPAGALDNTAERSIRIIINVNGNKAEKVLPVNQR